MTYDDLMESASRTREEKLVATYDVRPERLSRAIYSTIDAFVHASGDLREALARGLPNYEAAVRVREAGGLEVDS